MCKANTSYVFVIVWKWRVAEITSDTIFTLQYILRWRFIFRSKSYMIFSITVIFTIAAQHTHTYTRCEWTFRRSEGKNMRASHKTKLKTALGVRTRASMMYLLTGEYKAVCGFAAIAIYEKELKNCIQSEPKTISPNDAA